MLIRIFIIVKDAELRKKLHKVLARPDILIQVPQIRNGVWDRVIDEPSDIMIISEEILPKKFNEKLKELQSNPDFPTLIVLSDSVDPKVHAQLLADGCDAVLFAKIVVEQIRDVIETMLEKRRRQSQKLFFASQPLAEPRLADFVSESPNMEAFMNIVPRVVQSDTTLLIDGETGVGKERLACAIHTEGHRSQGRFVALNCGALPESLLESELFGHVRGAFTGATSARRGWFEIAHKGTLFLDEVGEIPAHLQVKLLRVLQEHEVQPIGSEKSFGVDVRVIAASNRPLEAEVEAGRFRRDLYHRLSVITINIPPLRNRTEDIPVLVNRHLVYISNQLGRHVSGFNEQAMQAMCSYPWPGNVRELNNVIERAILLCDNSEITLNELPELIAGSGRRKAEHTSTSDVKPNLSQNMQLPAQWLSKSLNELHEKFFSDFEKQYIEGLLISVNGKIGEAAKKAGIQQRTLYGKMKQYGIRKEDFRSS